MLIAATRTLKLKQEAAVRYAMVHLLPGIMPLYIVNEYPKSGGSWLAQMLSEAIGVPFPRNQTPSIRPSILHGHYLNGWGMKNVVVVWRDGRDVMVSWYYQCLFTHQRGNDHLVDAVRAELQFQDYDDIRANLPAFIEYSFTHQKHPAFSWTDFWHRWYPRHDVVHVRYEDLLANTAGELGRVYAELTGRSLSVERAAEIAEKFSFAQQTGRKPGDEDKTSFLRKGIAGDWRNHFSEEARITFDRYAGAELVASGYERDNSWLLSDR
jgi:hypothetical protein